MAAKLDGLYADIDSSMTETDEGEMGTTAK